MSTPEKRALKRLGRGIVALLISSLIAFFAEDPKYLVLMPIINAAGKYLRDRVGLTITPF